MRLFQYIVRQVAARNIVILLVFCAAGISATTLPESVQDSTPTIKLFVQAGRIQLGKPLSLVFEVTNRGTAKIELNHRIRCGRSYLGQSDEVNKKFGLGNNVSFAEGDTYRVWLHLATPVPSGGFLQVPDLLIIGGPGEPTFVAPGKSFLYKIDLPPELRLGDSSQIYCSLAQNKLEAARSETVKLDVVP